MVRHVLAVPKGQWLLQSAAGSGMGGMVVKLAPPDALQTGNGAGRPAATDELKALGGDVVIASSNRPVADQVRDLTGTDRVRFAPGPVGGGPGTGVFESLAADGRMLVYG